MTRATLIDDTRPGMATETSYSYQRMYDPKREAAIYNRYMITPCEPQPEGGPFFYAVRRWLMGVAVGEQVGVATAATREAAEAAAREMAGDDYDRSRANPSPTWWRGAEVIR